jgi:hypothetical protein
VNEWISMNWQAGRSRQGASWKKRGQEAGAAKVAAHFHLVAVAG